MARLTAKERRQRDGLQLLIDFALRHAREHVRTAAAGEHSASWNDWRSRQRRVIGYAEALRDLDMLPSLLSISHDLRWYAAEVAVALVLLEWWLLRD